MLFSQVMAGIDKGGHDSGNRNINALGLILQDITGVTAGGASPVKIDFYRNDTA